MQCLAFISLSVYVPTTTFFMYSDAILSGLGRRIRYIE